MDSENSDSEFSSDSSLSSDSEDSCGTDDDIFSQLSSQEFNFEVDSDDDRTGHYHWSKTHTEDEFVALDPTICSEDNKLRSPAVEFPDGTTPAEIISMIIDSWISVLLQLMHMGATILNSSTTLVL